MKNQRGQSLVMLAVILPALLLGVGVLIRSGQTAFTHYRVQKVIDRRALDILEIQAKGLARLGDINPYAKTVIDTRRLLENACKAFPFQCPYLLPAIAKLRLAQQAIAAGQMAIRVATIAQSEAKMLTPLPADIRGKVSLTYNPSVTNLFIEKQSNYKSETGAPYVPQRDFSDKQKMQIDADVKTEEFLVKWRSTKSFDSLEKMKIKTLAKVEMEDLRKKWEIRLKKITDRL